MAGPDEAELFVVPATDAVDAVARAAGVPVIATGAARLLRAAMLAGCVDYLREPWEPDELAVRAQAVLERSARRFSFAWGEIHFEGSTLATPRGSVRLTPREARLLAALLRSRGEPVSRQALSVVAWGRVRPAGRALDVHMSALRRKLVGVLPGRSSIVLKAVRREGYALLADEAEEARPGSGADG